jgi:hypothetical protein
MEAPISIDDGGTEEPDAAAAPDARDAASEDALPAPPPLLLYELKNAPFPASGHPSVGVHLPPGFDPWNRPGLLVFFHGHNNCVTTVMGSVDTPCTPEGPARSALALIEQIDTARVNAILVAVQLEYDKASGDPGTLDEPGRFRAMLEELLRDHLAQVLGRTLAIADLDRVVIGSHSGGYRATARCLSVGQVPVREIDLYDSLYGERAVFDAWMETNIRRFTGDGLRFADVYTSSGGTAASSRAMADDAAAWLSAASLSASLLDDDTTSTLPPSAFAHPVIFKRSALAHADVPSYYVQRLAAASGFAPL